MNTFFVFGVVRQLKGHCRCVLAVSFDLGAVVSQIQTDLVIVIAILWPSGSVLHVRKS